MKTTTIISKENRKTLEEIKRLHEAKSFLREYLAKGGLAKDYHLRANKSN